MKAQLLAFILTTVKDAFSKKNATQSPSTALSAALGAVGGYGVVSYQTQEEALGAGILTLLSVVMFFVNDRPKSGN